MAIPGFRTCFTLLLLFTSAASLYAQAPRFTKTQVGDSGFHVYLPGEPEAADVSYSPDSSVVYTMESTTGDDYHFGCIVVNLNGVDLTGSEEDMLTEYMEYLKSVLMIESAAGYGLGHTLATHPTAIGILDYWEDEEEIHWIVKGWAAESTLAVLFIYGPENYPNQNVVDMFFNGARFKGDR